MSRRCELTGIGPMVGHNVSHSNIKTKRRFLPALSPATLQSEALGQTFKLRISNAALRTLDFKRPGHLPAGRQGRAAVAARPEDQGPGEGQGEGRRPSRLRLTGFQGREFRKPAGSAPGGFFASGADVAIPPTDIQPATHRDATALRDGGAAP